MRNHLENRSQVEKRAGDFGPADALRHAAETLSASGHAGDAAIARGLAERAAAIEATGEARLARRDAAIAELDAHCAPGSDRNRARTMAAALLRYETTRWPRERMGAAPPLIHGAEGLALFNVLKASGPAGAPKERTIRTALSGLRRLGKISGVSPAHALTQGDDGMVRIGETMNAVAKISDSEVLAALAREPKTRKLIEGERAQKIADRRELVARIAKLDARAEASWPILTKAIEDAIAGVRDAEAKLRDANGRLASASAARSSASHAHSTAREQAEAELIAGADMATINAFKRELLDMLQATMRPGVIVSISGERRNKVTLELTQVSVNNLASIHARQAALSVAREQADLLPLEPDQDRVPDIIEAIRAALPEVDNAPTLPRQEGAPR